MLSRSFVDMPETDRKQFLPTAVEQAEDFILPVTPSDENGPGDISFTDTSDDNDGDLTYCMLICDTDTDSPDVKTPTVLTGGAYDIPSGSDVMTRKHSYGPDSDTHTPLRPILRKYRVMTRQ